MAEKNYIMQAVVPEAPRTIDEQQLHVYVPQGSTDNFGVFKPDGQQFVITSDGILRVDVRNLIKLAKPAATSQVVEDGGEPAVQVGIDFTDPDSSLSRELQFQYIFKNIKGKTGATGATGAKGDTGENALVYSGTYTETTAGDVMDEPIHLDIANFSRTPVKGDTFVLVYYTTETERTTISLFSIYNVYDTYAEAQPVSGTQYVITGPKGEQGIQGETGTPGKDGKDGVSITSVTQTGVQGGTRVTIALSNGQSTSFDVYNGINTNFQVVNVLPTENISTSTIYLVPSQNPASENVYDEYIYINGDWEHIGSTTIDLSSKLDKVTEVTPNIQFYAKAPDGGQVMTGIKGGNGITVDAASDNKSLEVKVGDTITLENQRLSIETPEGIGYLKISDNKIELDGSGETWITINGDSDATYKSSQLGDNILCDFAIGSNGEVTEWRPINAYYEISGVPTSTTSGTLPDNTSWIYLKDHPDKLRILFNKEFYQLADNQHTDGKLVFSHVGYEASQLIIKTITITIATRGWVLETVKPDKEPYHMEMEGTVPVSTDEFAKLLADENSYILWKATSSATAQYKMRRNRTSTDTIDYSATENNRMLTLAVRSGEKPILYTTYAQTTTQRTTALSSSSTDNQYPSAKATYDADQVTLTAANNYTDTAIANAITTALNTPV